MPLNEKRIILTNKGKEFLRNLRLSEGLPKDFSKNYQTVICWENGKNNPTKKIFEDYLKYFDLNLNYFKRKKFMKGIFPSIRELSIKKTTKVPKEKHQDRDVR